MKIKEILNETSHRPWKLPRGQWKFYQEWRDAIFLHWRVDLEDLRPFVPEELEIDLYEGEPWVSLVAFTMKKVRLKNLPAFTPISNFHEVNIRTYVKSQNKAGVYFLSIEASNRFSCEIAKTVSDLPYRFSVIHRNENSYHLNNRKLNDRFSIFFKKGKLQDSKTELEKWLTERYALFQETTNSINRFEIHHLEWPITEVTTEKLVVDYSRFKHLFKSQPDKMHYSPGVQVLAWGKNKEF